MREKSYKYILPDQNNKPDEKETNYHSIVIIGANGSGKSRLGVWMENNNLNKTHRISAQRSLIFNKYIELKSYKQSQNLLTFEQKLLVNPMIYVGIQDGMEENLIIQHQCLMIMNMSFRP